MGTGDAAVMVRNMLATFQVLDSPENRRDVSGFVPCC
jgi:hypothetical protein